MAESVIKNSTATLVYNFVQSYTDNTYFKYVELKGFRFGNMVWLKVNVQTNNAGDAITLPTALPASVTPSGTNAATCACIRYNTTTTTIVVTTGNQITIDHTIANTWYNANLCYITA